MADYPTPERNRAASMSATSPKGGTTLRFPAPMSPLLLLKRLREDGSSATLNRLGTSQHVADLRFMFSATLYVIAFATVFATVFGYWHAISDDWQKEISTAHSTWLWVRLFGDSIVAIAPFVGAVIAVGCGIVGWAYQSGSARLGIVDLFACEIGTICRVCAISDLTRRYVDAFNADLGTNGPPNPATIDRVRRAFSHYAATENYTPIFEHNAADLRVLDVKVVTNVTAFYTYFKAMKDSLRNLTMINPPEAIGDARDPWHEALRNVIYMQFLTFESARKAVRDLIEFDPNQVENTINILINELYAYQFPMRQFAAEQKSDTPEDFRLARLRLRRESYRRIVGYAYWRALDGKEFWTQRAQRAQDTILTHVSRVASTYGAETARSLRHKATLDIELARQWCKAAETAHELESRYALVFPDETIQRPIDFRSLFTRDCNAG